jgi:hypothetical protein
MPSRASLRLAAAKTTGPFSSAAVGAGTKPRKIAAATAKLNACRRVVILVPRLLRDAEGSLNVLI